MRGDRVGTEVGRGYAPECAGLDAQASYELRVTGRSYPLTFFLTFSPGPFRAKKKLRALQSQPIAPLLLPPHNKETHEPHVGKPKSCGSHTLPLTVPFACRFVYCMTSPRACVSLTRSFAAHSFVRSFVRYDFVSKASVVLRYKFTAAILKFKVSLCVVAPRSE